MPAFNMLVKCYKNHLDFSICKMEIAGNIIKSFQTEIGNWNARK